MILTFDLGNSDLVVGAFKDDDLVAIVRQNTDIYRSVDEYYYTIEKLLLSKKVDLDEINGAIISSVVPQITRVMQDSILLTFMVLHYLNLLLIAFCGIHLNTTQQYLQRVR